MTFCTCSQIQQIVLHNTKPKSNNMKHVIKTTVWRLRFALYFLTPITNYKYKKTRPELPLHTAHVTFQDFSLKYPRLESVQMYSEMNLEKVSGRRQVFSRVTVGTTSAAIPCNEAPAAYSAFSNEITLRHLFSAFSRLRYRDVKTMSVVLPTSRK